MAGLGRTGATGPAGPPTTPTRQYEPKIATRIKGYRPRGSANADGYYDVTVTANTGDGFTRRYAGRIA